MDIREHDFLPGAPERSARALGVITAIVIVAGLAMFAAALALLLLAGWRNAPAPREGAAPCNICGVVERISEVQPLPLPLLEGSRAEGTVILLAALGGARAPGVPPARIYETSVLHTDGSIRVLRNSGAPQWAPGDRVKVVRGQVERVVSR